MVVSSKPSRTLTLSSADSAIAAYVFPFFTLRRKQVLSLSLSSFSFVEALYRPPWPFPKITH